MTPNDIKDLKWLVACDAMAQIMMKCSKAQYFAFVIDKYGRVRGCGYNGTPTGLENCTDGGCPRSTSGVPSSTPYDYGPGLCWAVHAEVNALQGIDRSVLSESTLYVNGTCCIGCAKVISNNGLARVVCYEENRSDTSDVAELFSKCGIELAFYTKE